MDKTSVILFLSQFIVVLGNLITYAIIGRVIVSWLSAGSMHKGKVSQFLFDLTEPVINIARKLPHRIGMIDLAPIIVLLGINLLTTLALSLLGSL